MPGAGTFLGRVGMALNALEHWNHFQMLLALYD